MQSTLMAVALGVTAFAQDRPVPLSKEWTDSKTGLTWTTADNGSAVSRSQAIQYCSSLKLSDYQWRLPEIDELQTLFGGKPDDRGYRLIVPLKLTGWAWSATLGKEPGEGWALDFGDGARASVADGDAGLNRALCVRDNR